MVFQRTDGLLSAESPASARLTLIVISVGIAYLSWKLVETPFRTMARERSKLAVFATASGAMASTLALCGLVLITHGVPSRFPDRVVAIGAYLAYDSSAAMRTGRCFLLTNRQQFDAQTCLALDPKRANYLLVGDSHAAHLWFGLASALPEINIMQATASLCRPAARPGSRYDTRVCRALMQFVFDDFLVNNRVDKVLLAASWKDEDLPILSTTLDILKKRLVDVTVLGPIVEYDAALPRLLADEIMRGDPSIASNRRTSGVRERDLAMREMVTAAGATYLSVYDGVCRDGRCDEFVDGDIPIQFDAGHLTAAGAVEVARRLSTAFVRKLAKADDVAR